MSYIKTPRTSAAVSLLLSFSLSCLGETVTGHLAPSQCQSEDPQTHSRECALRCKSSGFGVVTTGGEYIAFDAAGNKKAVEALKSSTKESDLRVSVVGTREGAVLKVASIAWKQE